LERRIEYLVDEIERYIQNNQHHDSFMAYFSRNIPQFEEHHLESHFRNEMVTLTFDGAAAPYVMNLTTIIREIGFHLSRNISLLDESIGNDTEIMQFTFASDEGRKEGIKLFTKNYINENGAFYEVFDPQNGRIVTKIYDRGKVLEVISELAEEYGFRYDSSQPFVGTPISLSKIKPLFTVEVNWSNGCRIILSEEGKEADSKEVDSKKSLYEAYYSYMVENGYFYDGSEKEGKHIFVKANGLQ